MNVRTTKEFEKGVRRLSGKVLQSVHDMVQEMLDAESVNDITDCSKLIGFKYIYRVRVGSNRVFFLHHPPEGDVTLLYIVSRGEAYGKRYILRLRDKDV